MNPHEERAHRRKFSGWAVSVNKPEDDVGAVAARFAPEPASDGDAPRRKSKRTEPVE